MAGDHSPTARGDRAQRRLDVLEASASILEEGGWSALNMREVARRAGVSAGALYQWFEGKDEIYAELFTARLRRGIDAFNNLPADLGLDGLVVSMMRWVGNTWADLGRWQLDYAEIARTRDDGPVRRALAEAHQEILSVAGQRLAERADAEGIALRTDIDALHLMWASATGIVQRAEILRFDDDRLDQMLTTGGRALILGLTESD
ncbi:MAG: TetR/AcrR family transcriptional regulator [Actinomycetota bacterium]